LSYGPDVTLWDYLRAIVRRWPVVLAGGVVTISLCGLVYIQDEVYWTRTEVVFLAPSSRLYPNSLQTTSEDLIITAGVVARRISGPAKVTKFGDPIVNLVGTGVRDGWSIRLPDTGGQWASNFSSQTLVIEVVGPDLETVRSRQEDLIAQVANVLDELQREKGVDPVTDITSMVMPETAIIYPVSGNRARALGMTGALGIGATFAVIVLLEHRGRIADPRSRAVGRRSGSRNGSPAPTPNAPI
jgi:hypothetical protein